jgi:hypothetical protein
MALSTLRRKQTSASFPDGCFGVVIGIITVMLIARSSAASTFCKTRSRVVRHSLDLHQQVQPGHSHWSPLARRAHAERADLRRRDRAPVAASIELSVPFLDITNNFFGGKLMVSGGGKTSHKSHFRARCRSLKKPARR